MSRGVRLWPVLALGWILVAGCSQMVGPTKSSHAQQQWDDVRARVKLQLAEQQLQSGAIEESARTAAEAIMLKPSLSGGYVVMARAYIELGDPAKAERTLQNAATHDVRSASLCYTHGVLLEQQGRSDQACEQYAMAVDLEPDQSDYLLAEAECLVAADRFEEARELVQARLADGMADESLNMLAGQLASRAGDDAEAVEAYGRALVAMPQSAATREAYGLALLRTGRMHEATSMLRSLCEDRNKPASGTVVRAYARGCMATGESATALRLLIDFVRKAPSDLPAQMLLAEAAISEGDLMTALRSVDAAGRLAPNDPDVALMRAMVQIERDDQTGAIDSLSQATKVRPEDAVARCMLGSVLEVTGEADAAREQYTRAIMLQPGLRFAEAGLQRLAPPEPAATLPTGESSRVPILGAELTHADP